MTSATERLRKLLDKRGVEWTYADGTVSFANNERWFHAWAYSDGAMCVSMGYLTPEQAIAATLGSGTCKLEPLSAIDVTLNMLELTEWGACSECGCAVPMDARFCNECGKVVER